MIASLFENSGLYSAVELQRASLLPARLIFKTGQYLNINPMNPFAYTGYGRSLAASFELFERVTRSYEKPEFGIKEAVVSDKTYAITEEIVVDKTFCKLVHFRKDSKTDLKQPKIMIVAPMSGHYATLCRGTVEGLLPYYDVYITEWRNVRDIPLAMGSFDLDDYIDYVIDFIKALDGDVHLLAVCQPAVPVLAAAAILGAEKSAYAPRSMILIGGPIDTRQSPTEVNSMATERSMYWFATNVITRVPANYAGVMRRVYPGFLQLTGFMAMNLKRHVGEHVNLFRHLISGDGESAEAHRKFYNEYLSVMDLPAEFYLQTINTVFKTHALPKGEMVSRGRKIDPNAITKTALMAIEGEKDDISGIGQTKASISLCQNIPNDKKTYLLQDGVGHYGLFNGRKFREVIVPKIVQFTDKA